MMTSLNSVIALDIGTVRIGVALAMLPNGIPSPYATLENTDSLIDHLSAIIRQENVVSLVVGKPRGMNSQMTLQTKRAIAQAEEIGKKLSLKVHYQDEAVTSIKAEEELKARHKPYNKGDIDALSATYILEDYLLSLREV